MTVLHDAHRDDQLVAEIRMAIAYIAQRRERAEHVPAILLGATVAIAHPERDQNPALDAELFLDSVEGLRPLLGLQFSVGDAAAIRDRVDVIADGELKAK